MNRRFQIPGMGGGSVGISKHLWGSPRELLWPLPAARYHGGRNHPGDDTFRGPQEAKPPGVNLSQLELG